MPISNITNGESGLSVRTSLNQVIDAVNANPPISNPKVIYVTANGNDGTAEIGNPTKPYLTLLAAYNAGVSSATNFALSVGVGSFILPVTGNLSALCRQINGVGQSPALTLVSIAPNFSTEVTNTNGSPGPNIAIAINNVYLVVNTIGQNVLANDGNSYTAGDGGSVEITGFGVVDIISSGGNGVAPGVGSGFVTGGNAGSIAVSGPIIANGNLLSSKGLGYNDADGSDGPITLDNCDIRGATIQTSALTLGRCSYTSGIAVTNDKGGNAAW